MASSILTLPHKTVLENITLCNLKQELIKEAEKNSPKISDQICGIRKIYPAMLSGG